MRIEMNQEFINNGLCCPDGKRKIEYTDSGAGGVPGLFVEVTAKSPGRGSWYLRYKNVHGQTCYQRLGTTGDLALTEARKAAKKLRAEICLGADPKAEKARRREIPTFSSFFEDMYMPHAKSHKKSWIRDLQLFEPRIRVAFGAKRLSEITRHQIQSFHTSLAKDWQLIDKNPAARIPMLHENNKVEHYMDDEQLQRLLNVLRTDNNRMVCEIAMFLLATGCRLGEALSAKWVDVDLGRRVFVVRASNSKSKKLRSVPLNDAALETLERVGTQGAYEYVFPNKKSKGPYTRFGKVWERLRTKAGLPQLRLHDLRHQYASFLVNSGRSLYDVQQILGHSSPVVTQRYAHLSTHALQEAASAASARLTINAVKSTA
jgi:integrase